MNGPRVCVEEIVATSDTDSSLTWISCQIEGQQGIAEWMHNNPKYQVDWWVDKWKCVPGKYVIPGDT